MNRLASAVSGAFLAAVCAGCGGDGRVDMAAATAIETLAATMEQTVVEYHLEIESHDRAKEADVVNALVARMQRDAADDALLAAHGDAFSRAMDRLRADRETEQMRYRAALENAELLREVGRGLEQLAIESLSLGDERSRLLDSVIDVWRRTTALRKQFTTRSDAQ